MKRPISLKAIRLFLLTTCLAAALMAAAMLKPAGSGAAGEFWQVQDLTTPVIRLHVVAESNHPDDQRIKSQIAGEVLRLLAEYRSGAVPDDYLLFLQQILPDLQERLNEYAPCGGITAALVREGFPLRAYARKIYPAGEYQALKVVIGAGQGENWWCLLFPPLCLPMVQIEPVEHAGTAGGAGKAQPPGEVTGPGQAGKERTIIGEGRWKLKIWEQFGRWLRNN